MLPELPPRRAERPCTTQRVERSSTRRGFWRTLGVAVVGVLDVLLVVALVDPTFVHSVFEMVRK